MKNFINLTFLLVLILTSTYASTVETVAKSATSQDDRLLKIENTVNFFAFKNSIQHTMYDRNATIYHDIFKALQQGVIEKLGNPVGWNDQAYSTALWNGRNILNIGTGVQDNSNGLKVNVPSGSMVLWLRVLNDRWMTFRIREEKIDPNDVATNAVEIYACGWRGGLETAPDGTTPDSKQRTHVWCPIPLRTGGNKVIHSDKNSDDWISGIAFSSNPWNHAKNSAVAYHWNLNNNGYDGGITWNTHDWNGDVLANIPPNGIRELRVPVIPNGRDKLLYIVEHNNNWMGTMHGSVTVNGQPVDRFRTSYNGNPFAKNVNSKLFNKFLATRVPASLISSTDKFLAVRIDMTQADQNIHFREAGTHDLW